MPLLKSTRGIQLNKSHLLARGLVFSLLFNEGSGGKLHDSSMYGNTGTFQGNPAWKPGKYGSCIYLEDAGANEGYITVPDNPLWSGQITVSLWVRQLGSAQNAIALIKYGHIAYKWMLYCSTATVSFFVVTATGITSTAGFTLDENWHLLVGVYNKNLSSNRLKLYVDGVLVETANGYAEDISVGENGIYMGTRHNSPDITLTGYLDLPMIYNRALTPFDIARLYREPFCMFDAWNVSRISSIVADGFVEIAGSITAASILTDTAALKRARGIAGGVTAQSSLAGSIKVSRKISGVIAATSSLSGSLSLVGEVSRSRGSGFKPIEGAERLRGLRRSAFY